MGRGAHHRARALRLREERRSAEGRVRGRGRHVQPRPDAGAVGQCLLHQRREPHGRHAVGPGAVRRRLHAPRDHAQRRVRRPLADALFAGHRHDGQHRHQDRPRRRSAPQLPLRQLTPPNPSSTMLITVIPVCDCPRSTSLQYGIQIPPTSTIRFLSASDHAQCAPLG